MRLQKRQSWNQDLSAFGKLGDAGTSVMVDSTLQHVRSHSPSNWHGADADAVALALRRKPKPQAARHPF
jgi:hypothetical protein